MQSPRTCDKSRFHILQEARPIFAVRKGDIEREHQSHERGPYVHQRKLFPNAVVWTWQVSISIFIFKAAKVDWMRVRLPRAYLLKRARKRSVP